MMSDAQKKNPNDNSQPNSGSPPPRPRDAVNYLQNCRRHRSRGHRTLRRPWTPARRPRRRCLRAARQDRRHLGLHARNRDWPGWNRPDPESGPLQRLRFAPDQPAPGGDGLPGLPVCGEREARAGSEEVPGSRGGVGVFEGFRRGVWAGRDGEVWEGGVACWDGGGWSEVGGEVEAEGRRRWGGWGVWCCGGL